MAPAEEALKGHMRERVVAERHFQEESEGCTQIENSTTCDLGNSLSPSCVSYKRAVQISGGDGRWSHGPFWFRSIIRKKAQIIGSYRAETRMLATVC